MNIDIKRVMMMWNMHFWKHKDEIWCTMPNIHNYLWAQHFLDPSNYLRFSNFIVDTVRYKPHFLCTRHVVSIDESVNPLSQCCWSCLLVHYCEDTELLQEDKTASTAIDYEVAWGRIFDDIPDRHIVHVCRTVNEIHKAIYLVACLLKYQHVLNSRQRGQVYPVFRIIIFAPVYEIITTS